MTARRKRHDDHEEHENHERWLITYADMITLLMVLFIVLFAIGQTDLKKFAQLKNSLANSLDSKSGKPALDGGTGALDGAVGAKPQPIAGPAGDAAQIAQAQLALSEKQAHEAAVKA